MGGSKIELEPHILPMPDKRIYNFQIPRTTPYESWANWINFCSSWENGDFLGVKSVVTSSTLKMTKSKKKVPLCGNQYFWCKIVGPILLHFLLFCYYDVHCTEAQVGEIRQHEKYFLAE